jgi:acetyltransferase
MQLAEPPLRPSIVHRTMTVPRFNPAGRFHPDALFRPASVAVIGGEPAAARVLANLALTGFKGPIHTAPDAAALDAAPDLAVLALPPDAIEPAMQALAAKGCFAAIVPGAGTGLREAAQRTGVRVLGPYSFGLAVPRIGLNATLAHLPPPAGRLALISQSKALCRSIIDWAEPNGVGFSHIIGLGLNVDIGFGIALDWLSRDAGTGAILLDIRRIKNRRLFLSAARSAARLRPVVAMRPGGRLRDPEGRADLAFEAALRRAGVLTVTRFEDLLAAAETLSRARPARSEALAIVSNSVGAGRLAADAALRLGLPLALPGQGLDAVPTATLAEAVARHAAEPGVGGVLVVHGPAGAADDAAITAIAGLGKTLRPPLLACAMGETTGALHRTRLVQAGLPVFDTPEQAVRGFLHLVQDRRNRAAARELPSSEVLAVAPDRGPVAALFARVRQDGRLTLMQDEALAVLDHYGIPVVPTRTADSPEDAAVAAAQVGFPAVLKLRQAVPPAERSHGGLVLDLHDDAETMTAARLLTTRARRRGDPAAGLVIQRQLGRVRELAVQVADDATFGPTIAFGPGGTGAAASQDLAMDLPPLNLPLAHALIRRSRVGAELSQALRDRPAANETPVAETLVRISQMIVDFPEIEDLQLSALFADARGVTAADAWLRLRAADAPPGRLAISPYPTDLVELWSARDEALIIRPIRPEDAEAHGAFFRRLSPQDIRYRFFSAIRELSAEQMARLTQVDYDREMAFVAEREATGETVGVSRLVCEADGRSGEFAVIVQADMKGKGVATRLMQRLIDWGRTRGLGEIVGQVLADNAPMLAFVRHLGFAVHRMADEPDVMEVRLALEPGAG